MKITLSVGGNMQEVTYRVIGVVRSPFKEPLGTPIQSIAARGSKGVVEIFPEYVDGLKDVDGFSHLILLYHCHLAKPDVLQARPYMDSTERGVFAMRSPSRPNPIGFSIVRLTKVEGVRLFIQGVDVVDGTPLLDIKPYVSAFDVRSDTRIGWLQERIQKLTESRDNGRFSQ